MGAWADAVKDWHRQQKRMQQDHARQQASGMPLGIRPAEVLSVRNDPAEHAERRRVIDLHIEILSRYAALTNAR